MSVENINYHNKGKIKDGQYADEILNSLEKGATNQDKHPQIYKADNVDSQVLFKKPHAQDQNVDQAFDAAKIASKVNKERGLFETDLKKTQKNEKDNDSFEKTLEKKVSINKEQSKIEKTQKEQKESDIENTKAIKKRSKTSTHLSEFLDGVFDFIGFRKKDSDKLNELKRKDKREKHSINQSNSDLNRAKYAIKLDVNPVNSSVKENELIDQKVKERINNQQTEEQIGDIIFKEGDVKG